MQFGGWNTLSHSYIIREKLDRHEVYNWWFV